MTYIVCSFPNLKKYDFSGGEGKKSESKTEEEEKVGWNYQILIKRVLSLSMRSISANKGLCAWSIPANNLFQKGK